MKNDVVGIVFVLLLIVAVIPTASAVNVPDVIPTASELIGIKIEAKVISVSDSHNLLGGAILVGDVMTGKYVYESVASDNDPSPNIGLYMYASSSCGIEVKTSDFVFKTDPSHVTFALAIFNDFSMYGYPAYDEYVIGSLNNLPLSNGVLITYIQWDLYDSTATAVSSTDIPTTAPVLSDWDEDNSMLIDGESPTDPDQTFRITAQVTKAIKSAAQDLTGSENGVSLKALFFHQNLPFTRFLMKVFEWFPLAFPLLRYLLLRI